jgi:hypothetical protein
MTTARCSIADYSHDETEGHKKRCAMSEVCRVMRAFGALCHTIDTGDQVLLKNYYA